MSYCSAGRLGVSPTASLHRASSERRGDKTRPADTKFRVVRSVANFSVRKVAVSSSKSRQKSLDDVIN